MDLAVAFWPGGEEKGLSFFGGLRYTGLDDKHVFKVGGAIRLRDHLYIRYPYVTVAGQTAPGDGIMIRDWGLVPIEYWRVTKELPPQTSEVKPHPYGVELGVLMQMFRDTKARNLKTCLQGDFARVSPRTAEEICRLAEVTPTRRPRDTRRSEAERIHKAIKKTKIMKPSSDCIAPIGDTLILRALKAEVEAP